ncbi:low-specificity L-threonine aldolase [Buttiauxella noackiae ATCC 51607]|uniref:Low-specificity L-threonine aldolase n=1 Tax=Buttiauxella noackiae ATCC 51607 TaxID=1354255 RepID=A0A1B7HYS4_9ENTR|nr:low-specificity L-threonine aldolase [Buttiauxella noackiae]OAT20851.1 low-specificity L-threonine aldolase [Buttiauxella noackiae ATCC 51607]
MIDLRSDTVTRPGDEMLKRMMAAPTGDDVYGDDPTVNELQDYAAKISGKEAALFLPTGTQANLVALLSHCERGEEYIVGQLAHNYLYEAGGAAVLGSIQPQPIDANPDGSLPLDKVAAKIKPDDIHFARTKLLSLENTHNGKVLPREYLKQAWEFSRNHNLALHVDGARIFNAVVEYGCTLEEVVRYCDTFTICLSKGLGTPVGSLLVGSHEYIKRATRWRKMVGGGMRQAGILAAAGLYALQNNVQRLKEDHDNAHWLAGELREIGVDVSRQDTNMVFVRVPVEQAESLGKFMKERGVLMSAGPVTRLVIHLDVNREQLAEVVSHWQTFLQR